MGQSRAAKSTQKIYRRLLNYVLRYRFVFLIAILGNCLYSAIDSSFIYLLKPIVDDGFASKSSSLILYLPLVIVGGFFLRSVFNVISSYSLSYVTTGVVLNIRQDLFAKYQRLPASYYDRSSSGKMVSEMIYSVDQVSNASADAVQNLFQSAALVLGLAVVMFYISWQLTLIFIVISPVMGVLIKTSSKRIRRLSHEIQDTMKTVTSITEENVEAYQIVRFCGAQQSEIDKFGAQTRLSRHKLLKIVLSRTMNSSSVQVVGGIILALMIHFSAFQLHLTTGAFASMIAAMFSILKPLKVLTNLNATIQTGLAGASSVFGVLDQPEEVDHGTVALDRAKGLIEFKKVSFHYTSPEGGENKTVLKNIQLTVRPGELIALVGRSGAGKSTLVSLLPRFYDVIEGAIELDGRDIREYRLADLRKQFAVVSQSLVLFDDTIARNIAFGAAVIDQDKLMHAAIAAHALGFIEKLPEGFNSVIGDNGVLLSGGQRQRIAIARAIYQESPILILDEATSALDSESERQIQAAFSELMETRTSIVIAHRLSTIESADRIYVIDQGEIVESGTHAELLAHNGFYAKQCHSQYKAT